MWLGCSKKCSKMFPQRSNREQKDFPSGKSFCEVVDMVNESWNLIHSWVLEGSETILEASRSGVSKENRVYASA